jgi:hypothetical protein
MKQDRTLLYLTLTFGVLILCTAALATVGWLKANADANQLAASVHSKTHVKDILLWCNAINADRSYNKAFVARVTDGKVAYTLGPLPCESIADKTRAITKP